MLRIKAKLFLILALTVGPVVLYSNVLKVPDVYKHIQDAINAAYDGDTISVWCPEGVPPPYVYYENILCNKSLFILNRSFLPGQVGMTSQGA